MQINEIFVSLSGEADGWDNQGGLATFVRLQGCNLDCKWCDTKKARGFEDWQEMTVGKVADQCETEHVIITGGEPLLQQQDVEALIVLLGGHQITVETNGSYYTNFYCSNLRYVVDYKLPSSGMMGHMRTDFLGALSSDDVIKFVVADMTDYATVKRLLEFHHWRAKKVLSPTDVHTAWPNIVANCIIEDRLEGVKLSLQQHKLLRLS